MEGTELKAKYIDFCISKNIKVFGDIKDKETARQMLEIAKPLKKQLAKEYREGNNTAYKAIKNLEKMIYYCNTAIKNDWFPG